MSHGDRDPFRDGVSRRTFIKGAGAVAVLGGSLYATAPAAARARQVAQVDTPLSNLVISCAENRSFDHYFGYAPQVQAAGFGPPPGYSQPDADGNPHEPFEFTSLQTPDPPHHGARCMSNGTAGRWTASTRALRRRSATATRRSATTPPPSCPSTTACSTTRRSCGNYFCSLLGPDLAEPLLLRGRHVGRDHDERHLGLRHLRLPDHPRPARRRRRDLEGLQHELGQRPVRQHGQRLRLLGEVRARQSHARDARAAS